MAASNTNVIRVRLYFDYPPPSVSDCRMCWVLVDLNKCRVVADIASVIREKFDFSRRSILSLFIEECYLPHTESIYVVRDNDTIRVKVDTLTLSNGSQSNTSVVKSKKRRRDAEEEEEPTRNRVSEEWKKKKKRKKESQEADSNQAAVEERRKEDKQKKKKKKKDKKVVTKTTASSTGPSPTSSTGPSPTSSTGPSPTVVKADKNPKKAPAATAVSVNGKATAKTPNGETDDSSDSSESSEEEEAPVKNPCRNYPPNHTLLTLHPLSHLKPPLGGDNAGFYFNYEGGQRQQTPQPPSYQKDSLINSSVVFQNPSESVPKRDYSEMPLLAAPPQDGQKIAFKLLELTENYTPEVSEYKEGKIIHFDHSTKQIELELLSAYQAPGEPGKFDLVYQNADGSESVEYAVSRGSRVTERWDSLLEPRLVVGNLS
ncbi:LOW QUALITY PROTEIN: coilin-like [Oncorhynchus masou masou]|uniref:LOW QUALITY PROTEIN: coilin-like n=1 Tax=Oncorhynchus masou masou TaxID=90313 RepID=UPI0031837F5F